MEGWQQVEDSRDKPIPAHSSRPSALCSFLTHQSQDVTEPGVVPGFLPPRQACLYLTRCILKCLPAYRNVPKSDLQMIFSTLSDSVESWVWVQAQKILIWLNQMEYRSLFGHRLTSLSQSKLCPLHCPVSLVSALASQSLSPSLPPREEVQETVWVTSLKHVTGWQCSVTRWQWSTFGLFFLGYGASLLGTSNCSSAFTEMLETLPCSWEQLSLHCLTLWAQLDIFQLIN